MFALTRMVVRAGFLAALVATVMSIATTMAADGDFETLEAHAGDALDWLSDFLARLGNFDPSVGDITLGDLASPSGWVDLGSGLFAGGGQPGEIDPVIADAVADRIEPGQLIDAAIDRVSIDDLPLDAPPLGGGE